MSKNNRTYNNQSNGSISRKKTSLYSQESRSLKPTSSYQKLLKLNQGILPKVRSFHYGSIGGEVVADNSFLDLGNLFYEEDSGKLKDSGNRAVGTRIKQVVRARKEFTKHTKEEVGLIGLHDPAQRRALKKLKIPHYKKNDKIRAFLKESIKNTPSFTILTDKQIELVVNALKPRKVAPDVNLLVEGDIGSSFFIVHKGTLTQSERQKDSREDKVICKLTRGDVFGELAVFYGTRRQMSVKTSTLCHLWKMKTDFFKRIMAHNEDEHEQADYELILDQLKLMPLVVESKITENEEQLTFLARNIHHVRVKKGQLLITKGDPGGDMMYLIKQGRVKCTRAGNESEPIAFMTGDYFGEGSLLHRFMVERDRAKSDVRGSFKNRKKFLKKYQNQWKRAANVYASRDTEFFVLDYDAFKRLAELDNEFFSLLAHNYGLRILKTSKLINSLRKTYRDYLLQNLEILEYKDKDVIVQRGELEKVLFLVVEGRVEISKSFGKTQKPKSGKKPKKYVISVGGAFGIKQFFDKTKPYNFGVVASGSVKIFAITQSIFFEVFGDKLSVKEVLKTGDPAIDEDSPIDFSLYSNSCFTAVKKALDPSDPRSSSKVLQKISNIFEVDTKTSSVKRRKESVKVKRQEEVEQLGKTIETHIKMKELQHSKKMRKIRKYEKLHQPECKSESMEVFKSKFKVVGAIGMGTFGVVKMCKPRGRNKQPLALKILEVGKIVKLGQQESVVNERDVLSELAHPFVLKYIGSYKDKKQVSILTELLTGGELFEIIERYRKEETYMPDEHAIFYAACMVETFTYLHKKDIIYRDIKPENIMIDALGYTRLVDFGFAKKCKFRTFTRCGTPEYFAPELLAQRGYNKSVDLWGIGILTYEMMTGTSPFYDENYVEMLDGILNHEPEFGDGFPEDAEDFIEALLDKEPNERLGMSLKNPKELKKHPFMVGISWRKLKMKELAAPWIPKDKKIKIRTEKELRQRIQLEGSAEEFQIELKEKDYKGWYSHF